MLDGTLASGRNFSFGMSMLLAVLDLLQLPNILYLVMLAVCAFAYYKLGELDPEASPIVWAGMSIVVFIVTWLFLHWGIPGNLFGQLCVLAGITAMRIHAAREAGLLRP